MTLIFSFAKLLVMLAIKLKRIGKKHQAAFRVIVDEKRHRLQGKNVEDLGWYNPSQDKFEINKERVQHWLKIGAKPTDTVHNLLVSAGAIEGKKIPVHKKPKIKRESAPATSPAAETSVSQPTKEEKSAEVAPQA